METTENQQKPAYSLLYQLARAWNQLDVGILEPLLYHDIVFTSQWINYPISGSSNFISYMTEKFAAIRSAEGKTVTKARMAILKEPHPGDCVLLTQITGNEIRQLLLTIETHNHLISQIHAKKADNFDQLQLTGIFP